MDGWKLPSLPSDGTPLPLNLLSQEAQEAFRAARFGLMMHFGLYSRLGGVYKGRRGPAYAEWIQCWHQIPRAEMEALARDFCPESWDADRICRLAKTAGMKYLVFTAKHHEGFALFHSLADVFTSTRFSRCRRDFVGELANSCARHGLHFGLYYSQVIDWHEEHGGGYGADPKGAAGPSWDNRWDFPDKARKNYALCFEEKIVPQLQELLTQYGPIFNLWFDMPLDSTREQSERLYREVKRLQPDCLVNSRLGHGLYDYVSFGDNEIPDSLESSQDGKAIIEWNGIDGIKPSPLGLYESAGTMNHSWGYCSWDEGWKSPEAIRAIRAKLERLGVLYLLNAGPDGEGRLPKQAEQILRALG